MTTTDARACQLIPDPGRPHPLTHANPLRDAEPPHLLTYLATVPDPRAARGRRHSLIAILGLAAAAVLAGARSMTAIAEWGRRRAPADPGRAGCPPRRPRPLHRPGRGHHPPDAGPPGR